MEEYNYNSFPGACDPYFVSLEDDFGEYKKNTVGLAVAEQLCNTGDRMVMVLFGGHKSAWLPVDILTLKFGRKTI